jgi:hypothetical protein
VDATGRCLAGLVVRQGLERGVEIVQAVFEGPGVQLMHVGVHPGFAVNG